MTAPKPCSVARPRKTLAEAKPSRLVLGLLRVLGGAYAHLGCKFEGVEFRGLERLVEAYRSFFAGESRLIIAFRHAYGDEPQLLAWALGLRLPKAARAIGLGLEKRPHALFVHGYEVPLWSGALVRFILPRMGALPVNHVRLDQVGLKRIRAAISGAAFPLALAPEGQVSYRSRSVPRMEEGAARLAFWCAEELAAAGRSERVLVLPLSISYRYDERDRGRLEGLVARLEADCGLEPAAAALPPRLDAIFLRLLATAEVHYARVHGYHPPSDALDTHARLDALFEKALSVAESSLGLKPEGDRISRVYRIRSAGWALIFPMGEGAGGKESPLERSLADRGAGEAWYLMRHMELVDLGHYIESHPLAEAVPFDLLVERAYDLADLASRLVGGNFSHRPNRIRKRAYIYASSPIDLSSRLSEYRKDRRGVTSAATEEIRRAYNISIEEYTNVESH